MPTPSNDTGNDMSGDTHAVSPGCGSAEADIAVGVGREQVLAEAFVRLADTLVADFDVIDVLHELTSDCVALLGADAAGLLLSDQRGNLRVASASSEKANLVELFQIQADQGPCRDSFHSGAPVNVPDLDDATATGRWPEFSRHARTGGYRAVHAVPMRLREHIIGALNLFSIEPGEMSASQLRVGQALADVATIAVLQDRSQHDQARLAEQLQYALNSRIIIEQAKGVLAERAGVDTDEAFTRLRRHARSTNRRLTDLARSVTDNTLQDAHRLLQPGTR
jgi:GAF domain-containing protein